MCFILCQSQFDAGPKIWGAYTKQEDGNRRKQAAREARATARAAHPSLRVIQRRVEPLGLRRMWGRDGRGVGGQVVA